MTSKYDTCYAGKKTSAEQANCIKCVGESMIGYGDKITVFATCLNCPHYKNYKEVENRAEV